MKNLLSLVCGVLLATAFFSSNAVAATVNWGNAPAACLPERAEKWGSHREYNTSLGASHVTKNYGAKQACACPDAREFCPQTLIRKSDITFTVKVKGNTYVLKGDDPALRDYNIPSVASGGDLRQIVHQAIRDRGYNLNSKSLSFTISTHINIPDFTAKLPDDLASRCCASICPTGLNLTKNEVMVPIYGPKYPEAQEDIDRLQEAMEEREALINSSSGGTSEEIANLNMEIDGLKEKLNGKVEGNETDGFSPILEQQGSEKTFAYSCDAIKAYQNRSGCLAEGTQITLADGKKVEIENLKVGDLLRTDIGDSKVVALNKFSQEYDTMFGVNGEKPFITIEHPILTDSGWKAVDPTKTAKSGLGELGKLAVGDKILTETGDIEIKSIEEHKIEQNAVAYNIKIENSGALLANDMFVSGFRLVEINY